MSPLDRPVARHLRRSSIAWALTWALLLPFPAEVNARSAEPRMHSVSEVRLAAAPPSLDTGAAQGHARAAEPVAAPPGPIGPVGYLPGAGVPGAGGVAGILVALVLLVVSANMAGMHLARTRRFRRMPSAPRSV